MALHSPRTNTSVLISVYAIDIIAIIILATHIVHSRVADQSEQMHSQIRLAYPVAAYNLPYIRNHLDYDTELCTSHTVPALFHQLLATIITRAPMVI